MNGALNIHPKVAGMTLTGALSVLAVWILGLAHVQVDPVAAGALTVVIGAFGGWLAPILKREQPPAQ